MFLTGLYWHESGFSCTGFVALPSNFPQCPDPVIIPEFQILDSFWDGSYRCLPPHSFAYQVWVKWYFILACRSSGCRSPHFWCAIQPLHSILQSVRFHGSCFGNRADHSWIGADSPASVTHDWSQVKINNPVSRVKHVILGVGIPCPSKRASSMGYTWLDLNFYQQWFMLRMHVFIWLLHGWMSFLQIFRQWSATSYKRDLNCKMLKLLNHPQVVFREMQQLRRILSWPYDVFTEHCGIFWLSGTEILWQV